MTATYTLDGSALTSVRNGSAELVESAELTNVGSGSFVIDDPDGTIAVVGHKDIAIDEDSCTDTATFRGFARAIAQADKYVEIHRTELDEIETGEILLPPSKVNLLRAGHRVQVRVQHGDPEGYAGWTWWRVLERRVRPDRPAGLYGARYRLSPQEAGCTPASVVQYKGTPNVGSTVITLDSPVTVGNLLVAIGARGGINAGSMQPGQGFTELAQAYADDCCGNNGSTGTVFAAAKVATSTAATYARFSDAAEYQWWLYEIAGAGLADISILSADHQSGGGLTTATINVGTFSNASGVGIMCASIGRSSDQSETAGAFNMGTWTEDFDNQFDPTVGDPVPSPWVGVGHTSASAADIVCSWGYTESGHAQGVGEWAAIALLVNGTGC